MSILQIFIIGFVYTLNVTSYSLNFIGETKGYLGNSYYTSSIYIDKNQRTERDARTFNLNIVTDIKRNISLSTHLDRKVEIVSTMEGKSSGAKLSLSYTPNLVNLSAYVEGVNIQKDTFVSNMGYGITGYKIFTWRHSSTLLNVDFRKFDIYHRASSHIKWEYTGENRKLQAGVSYAHFDMPYGINQKDTRGKSGAYVNIYAEKNGLSMFLFTNFDDQSSKRMLNLNYKNFESGAKLETTWQKKPWFNINGGVEVTRKLKVYSGDSREKFVKYGVLGKILWQKVFINMNISMKRYDFWGLIPLDRDERFFLLSGGIGPFLLKYTRTDINYIKREYEDNSGMEENYVLECNTSIGKFKGSRIVYNGQLFAGMELPVYSERKGYYQRYWKNRIRIMHKDSSFLFSSLLMYKQIGEFTGDSIYKPVSNVEWAINSFVRILKKKYVKFFAGESAYFIVEHGFREWHITFRIDTGKYILTFGTGKLAGRKDTFVEFKSWI